MQRVISCAALSDNACGPHIVLTFSTDESGGRQTKRCIIIQNVIKNNIIAVIRWNINITDKNIMLCVINGASVGGRGLCGRASQSIESCVCPCFLSFFLCYFIHLQCLSVLWHFYAGLINNCCVDFKEPRPNVRREMCWDCSISQ